MDEEEDPAMGCVAMLFWYRVDRLSGESDRSSKRKQHHLATVRLTYLLYKRIDANPLAPSILPSLHKGRRHRILQSHLFQRSLHQPHFAKVPHPSSYRLSLKMYLFKIEGLAGSNASVFESLSSDVAIADSTRLKLRSHLGLGASSRDPMVLVVGVAEAEKRSSTPQVANKLIENPDSRETHYSTSDISCVVVLDSHPI